jgi:UDP-N-acetylmuramoyl-L-alanyl-D-glutamate--2,6-diaminopimelate ligase
MAIQIRAMFSVAVTGTNGKTSCSQWLAKALSMEKCDTAVIGTLGTGIYHQGVLGQLSETGFTTPTQSVCNASCL